MKKYIIKYLTRNEQDDTEFTFEELKEQFKIEDDEWNTKIDKCEDTFDLLQVVNEFDREYDFEEVFYSNLKRIRKSKDLTRQELADKSSISINMIIKYENGERDIDKSTLDTLTKLAIALNVNLVDILEDDILKRNVVKCI